MSTYYCEVYMPTDRLARGQWEAGITWQVRRAMKARGGVCGVERLLDDPRAKRSKAYTLLSSRPGGRAYSAIFKD